MAVENNSYIKEKARIPERPFHRLFIEELDALADQRRLDAYITTLNSPNNRHHFIYTPEDYAEARKLIGMDRRHIFIAHGEVKNKLEIVGTFTIETPIFVPGKQQQMNDDSIQHFGIHEDFQGRGFGTDMMLRALEWGFDRVPYAGQRRRTKMGCGVIETEGWESMEKLVRTLGFSHSGLRRNQVTEFVNGNQIDRDVHAFDITLQDWHTLCKERGYGVVETD